MAAEDINSFTSQRGPAPGPQKIDSFTSGIGRVSFEFWGSPVVQDPATGNLVCPGFTEYHMGNAWDLFVIPSAGGYLPGACEVSCHRYRDLDKKKPKGDDGARLTLHGLEPAQVEIAVTIWTPQQLKDLQEMWAIMFTQSAPADKNGKYSIESFDVSHPVLKTHDVKSIVFQGGEGPVPGRVPKTRTFIIRAIEFIAPKKQQKKTTTPSKPRATLLDAPDQPQFQKPGENPANMGPL